MTAPIRLTAKQVAFLKMCSTEARSSWDAGSTTICRLRGYGLIVGIKVHGWTKYIATDAGRAWLAANGGAK